MPSHLYNYCLLYISFTFFSHCSICKNLGARVIFYYKSSKKHASREVLKNVEDSLNERVKKRKFLRKPFFWKFRDKAKCVILSKHFFSKRVQDHGADSD